MIYRLKAEEYLKFNAQLQKKKNAVRIKLKEAGVLERKGANDFDHYKYFTEAQYKKLFTGLLADAGLELKVNEKSAEHFTGTDKQPFGWRATLEFSLLDTDSGFYETATSSGIGMDKGDKAIYKAYTGALKYYLANNFMVATGDDPERPEKRITKTKAKTLGQMVERYGLDIKEICAYYEHQELEEFTESEYAHCLKKLDATKKAQEKEAQNE